MRLSHAPSDPAGLTAAPSAVTVGEVVGRIRALIEGTFAGPFWVQGEISNCSYPASGHIYFSLVDEQATDRFGQRLVLPCVFFRGANQSVKFRLEDGMKLLCFGEVTTYEARGQYQLRVLRVQPKGKGDLQVAFEQMRERLQAEGLFDEARKRPMPVLPERVALITSGTGSVVHDMVERLRGRIHVIIMPVKVQGEGAAQEIADAIRLANARRLADVMIVGRGGGSLEELWAFNEERVARAIFTSEIPVISAVGHQDDWTIADYVADLRASTPTHAAQLLAQAQEDRLAEAQALIERLVEGMRNVLDEEEMRVSHLADRLRLLHPAQQMAAEAQRVETLYARLMKTMAHRLDSAERHLGGLAGQLQALSPLAVLARGYSITFHGGAVITDAKDVVPGARIVTRLSRGRIESTVERLLPTEAESDGG